MLGITKVILTGFWLSARSNGKKEDAIYADAH